MFDQLSLPGIRQVSHAPMPVGNIGQAVALQLLNNMYNNFDYESNQTGIRLDSRCTPIWQCTAWSPCSSTGTQTRTCTDANNCGTLMGKPTQSQGCVPPRINALHVSAAPLATVAATVASPPRIVSTITRAPVIAGVSIPAIQPPRQPAPPPPPPVDYPPMGNGNALPPEEPPTKPEEDQAAAAEAAKKVKQKWTYIVLTIIVLIIIAYFYFRNRNKTN